MLDRCEERSSEEAIRKPTKLPHLIWREVRGHEMVGHWVTGLCEHWVWSQHRSLVTETVYAKKWTYCHKLTITNKACSSVLRWLDGLLGFWMIQAFWDCVSLSLSLYLFSYCRAQLLRLETLRGGQKATVCLLSSMSQATVLQTSCCCWEGWNLIECGSCFTKQLS